MNYWLTTQWPPEVGDPRGHKGVYLRDGRQQAGRDLRPGDIVLIYESRGGKEPLKLDNRGQLRPVKRQRGGGGIVAIAEVLTKLKDRGGRPTLYKDGSKIWWRWHTKIRTVSESGFVPMKDVNRVLRYKKRNVLHGFGDLHSGLKKLEEEEYHALHDTFRKHPRSGPSVKTPPRTRREGWSGVGGGEESERHRLLKEYVAADPSAALGVPGLKTVDKEFLFPTGDRADLILKDRHDRLVGLEVEDAVGSGDLAGVLQAIKYRFMLAVLKERRYSETRAFLVAHSLSSTIRRVCNEYDVEPFLVRVSSVKRWAKG